MSNFSASSNSTNAVATNQTTATPRSTTKTFSRALSAIVNMKRLRLVVCSLLLAMLGVFSATNSFATTYTTTYSGGGTLAQTVYPGQSNVVIYSFSAAQSTTLNYFTAFTFTTTGTATTTDISSYSVYMNNTTLGTLAPVCIGTVACTGGAATYSIPVVNRLSLAVGNTYLFTILANFKTTASTSPAHTIAVNSEYAAAFTWGNVATIASAGSAPAGSAATTAANNVSSYFPMTAGLQTYTVPAGCTHLAITAAGAQGGTNGDYFASPNYYVSGGGLGGLVTETVTATASGVYTVMVGGVGGNVPAAGTAGGPGGFNGGGAGGSNGTAFQAGGGGGGATYVCGGVFTTSSSNLLVVAGGGGGAGLANTPFDGDRGGLGGGATGAAGYSANALSPSLCGQGGSQSAGGAAGTSGGGAGSATGLTGATGLGLGGGGGGGYFGGGSGTNGGGGGGSSFVPSFATAGTNSQGINYSNGYVIITPLFNVTGGGNYCSGGSGVTIGLDGSVSGASYQLYNGAATVGSPVAGTGSAITFGTTFTAAGTYSVAATSPNAGMLGTATVTIIAAPNLTGWSSPTAPTTCSEAGNVITVNCSTLVAGTYTVTYSISGGATGSGLTAVLTMGGGGTGTFTTLPITSGVSTTVTVTQITNTTGCSTAQGTSNTVTFSVTASPVLTAGVGVTEDNIGTNPITFTYGSVYQSAITMITAQLGSGPIYTLTPTTDYTTTSSAITLIPNTGDHYLTTSGNYTITVYAPGYSACNAVVYQTIASGNATHLVVTTAPVASGTAPGLTTQPIVTAEDIYGNAATTYGTSVVATAVGSSWTIGGTSTSATTSGVANAFNFTATYVSSPYATVLFTSGSLTVSASFSIPTPSASPMTWYTKVTGASANLTTTAAWTSDPLGGVGATPFPSDFTLANRTWDIYYGSSPSYTSDWSVAGTVNVGDGTDPITFVLPSAYALLGTVNVANYGTLDFNNANIPALGTVASLSTLVFDGSASYIFPNSTGMNYGNLTFNTTGNTSFTNPSATTFTVNGNLVAQGTGTTETNAALLMIGNTGNIAYTFNIGGNFTLKNSSSVYAIGAGAANTPVVTFNIAKNDSVFGTAAIFNGYFTTVGTANEITINLNGGTGPSNPQIMYSVLPAAFYCMANLNIAAGSTGLIPSNTTYTTMDASNATQYCSMTVNGTLMIGASGLIFDQWTTHNYPITIANSSTATLMIADPLGIYNVAATYHSFGHISALTFNTGANYVFNGTTTQVTGTSFPAMTLSGSGSFTCNNPAGVTLTNALTVASGTSMNLETGAMSTTNLTVNSGANVNVDNGNFSAALGTYTGIKLNYVNLGNNNLTVSTANTEWPASLSGSVNINKPGATISLNASKVLPVLATYGNMTLTSGTLSAGSSNISLTGNWSNNNGTSAFTPGTGIVSFTGTAVQTLGGTFPTTFNTLNINNSAGSTGVTLNVTGGTPTTTFASGSTVQLQQGVLTTTTALAMSSGSNMTRDGGTISATPGTYSGVNLSYADLGNNIAVTTGNEWPTSFNGNVTDNKAATVTLNTASYAVTGNITLNSGILAAGSNAISLTGNWTNNNVGATPLTGTNTVTLNGSGSQTIGGTYISTFYNLTLGAAASLTYNAAVTNTLALGNFNLTTNTNTFTCPGNVPVTRGTGYVIGNLYKTTVTSPINFEVGDANYAPVSLALTGAPTGSIGVAVTHGNHPALGGTGSVIDGSNDVAHYWTITGTTGTAPTTVAPTFTYNTADVDGGVGSNTGYQAQVYNSGTWGPAISAGVVNTMTPTPSTSLPASATYVGAFAIGNVPPGMPRSMFANYTPPTEDNLSTLPITFTDSGSWAESFTLVTAQRTGSTVISTLTSTVDYIVNGPAGTLSLLPGGGGHTFLDTAGFYTITVYSSGYTGSSVVQQVLPGAANHLVMGTPQPSGPSTNGGTLGVQPTLTIVDQYGNLTTSSAVITATVGAGTWTLGGLSTSATASSGSVSFSSDALTATSLGPVTGATIVFSSPGITSVTSNPFSIVPPNSPALSSAAGATVDNPFTITFTDNATWRGGVSATGVTVNGTTLPSLAWSLSSGALTLTPSASSLLQTAGTYTITVSSTGFAATSCVQVIGVGAPNKLIVTTQPAAPTYNGGTLATQPVVKVADQYGNLESGSTAIVTAAVGAGSWSIGGPSLTATASGGLASFSNLTATSGAYVTGATISFTSPGLASVTSAPFNIPGPATNIYYNINSTGALADLSLTTSWTTDPVGAAAGNIGSGVNPANFTAPSSEFIVVNGTNPVLANTWTVSGLGSYIVVGNSSSTINFSAGTFQIAGTASINVTANATLTYNNSTLPTFGTLSSLSTVVLTGTQTIPNSVNWGNLTYSGATTGTLTTGIYNIAGSFSQTSGTVTFPTAGAVITINIGKDFNLSGGQFNLATQATSVSAMYVYGNFYLSGGTFYSNASSGGNITLYGNYSRTLGSIMGGTSYYVNYTFANTASTLASPQHFIHTSSGATFAEQYVITSGVTVQMDGNFVSNTTNNVWSVSGVLNMQGFVYSGTGAQFTLYAGGTLVTQHAQGISSTALTGCLQNTGAKTFNGPSNNIIFNGTSAQVTGNLCPTTFGNGYYMTINNAAGVTVTNTTQFSAAGSILNLQNGLLANSAGNLIFGAGSYVMVDNGTFSVTPTAYAGVNVEYANLGYNQTAVTTGLEWPNAGFQSNIIVNKPGATVSLNANKVLTNTTTSAITLTAGTLDATTSNYTITTACNWTNNSGSSAFVSRGGTVTFNGGSGTIGGSYGTGFNILTIAANTTLSAATTFASGKTLNLQSGTFSNGSNLSMSSGSNVTVDNGTLNTAPSVYSGVNLTYTSLGANTSITTGGEWPASFTGNVVVNKTGQTITLGGNKAVTGPVTITAGTLDVSASNYGISLTGTWTNNGTFNARNGTVTFNGSSAQTNAGSSAAFYNLTLNNTAGLTLGLNTTVSNLLTLTNGVITTGIRKLTMTTAPGTVSRGVSSTSNYVNGTLEKAVTGYGGTTPINFEVGDADYAPVSISTSANLTGAGATLAVTDTAGHHPNYASAGIDGTFYVDHYWTISAPVAPTGSFSITPTFSYNTPSDVGGGSNTSPAPWVAQMWNGTAWTAVNTAAADPTGNSTSVPTTSTSYLGQYIVGLNDQNTPPAFTAAVGVNEDNASVTPAAFTLSPATGSPSIADWKAHITLVTAKRAGGSLVNLTGGGTDYGVAVVGTAGTFSLVPTSADNYLTTAGTYTINISSVGYTTATLVQTIAAGAPAAMSITDQPTNVTTNGSVIPGLTPPYIVINMTDRFGNAASGSATITGNAVAGVGGATWTAGSNTITGSSPISFSTITASSFGAVTGATIQFTGISGTSTLTPTTSNTFNINAPAPPALTAAAGATVDNPFSITYTDNSVWRAAITSVLVNGSTLAPAAWSTSAGNLTLTPSASTLLQTVGSYTITVLATGYTNDVLSTQPIAAGVGATLVMSINPTAPVFNGGPLVTQPVVLIKDHYNNATTSTASVSAGASGGSSSWTLGGTTTVNGVSGTVTYSGLTATSALYDPGATITFSITSTYGTSTVTSLGFNIPNPPITYYDKPGTGNDLSVLGNWTTSTSGVGGSAPGTFVSNSQKFVIRNGTNPTLTAGSLAISGTGSYLNVGNDTASVNFVIPSGQSYTGLINVAGNSTLTTANTTMPTWGSLDPTSTVVFNGASQAIPVTPSYGNLTFNGTTGTIASGTLSVGGTFSVTGSSTLTSPNTGVINVAGLTSVSGGTLTNAGTGTINLRGDLSVTGTGAITGTTLNTVNFVNTATTQNITWTGGGNGNTTLNVNASVTASLSSGLPLSGGSNVIVNGTLVFGATNAISGLGAFTLGIGGTLNTSNTSGLDASITTGTRTFNSGSYVFNGATTTPWPAVTAISAPVNVSIAAVAVTSNKNFTVSGTLTVPASGTLDMSTNTLGGIFTVANNGTIQTENTGATPFTSNLNWGSTGVVIYDAGAAQTVMAGTYNNLTLNNAAGGSLSGNATVNNVLALNAGNLNVGGNTLTLGTAATVTTTGSFSSTDMIIASNASGQVLKQYAGSGSFTYPIGDVIPNYSPITLSVTGAGSVGVYVRNVKDPNDHAVTDYLNRYWHVATSGITNYSVTSANYVSPGDVVGTESNIHAGQWTGTIPWIMGATESGSSLSFGTISRSVTELSGLSAPVPSFTVSPGAAVCAGVGNTVTYGTQSGETSYVWNVPGTAGTDYVITSGGTGSSNNTVTLYWITPGSMTVTVNYTDADGLTGISPATNTTFVSSLTLAASNNSPACVGGTVNLSSGEAGTATPVTYAWSGPISYGNTASNPTLSISGTGMAGTYTIVATGGSCTVTSTTIVTVNTLAISPSNDGPACVGGTINLSANASGSETLTTYTWSGPSYSSSSMNPVLSGVTTATSGVYTLTVSGSGSGCSGTNTTTVVVNTIAAAPNNDGPACVGGTVNLTSNVTGTATPTTYFWNGPIGYTRTIANPSLSSATTAMSGTYNFTVTATGSNCIATGSTSVIVNTIGITAANDGPACVGGTINLSSTPSGTATPSGYSWSGPSFSAGVQNPLLTASATTAMSGVYVVTITATGSACSAIGTTTVTVNTVAIAPSNDGPACVGGTVNLFANATGSETITSYSWSGPSYSSPATNPSLSSVTTDMAGTYTLTVTGSGSGCSATNTTTVVVNTIAAAPNNDGPACVGGTVNLTSNVTGTATPGTYFWSGPIGFTNSTANPSLSGVTTAMAGTYNFTVTATGSNCVATGSTIVTVNTFSIAAGNDGPACVGGSINLTSTPSGSLAPVSYSWGGPLSFGAGTQNTSLTTSATTDMSGIYTVTITAPGSACSATATTNVVVNTLATAPSNDGPACVGSTVNLFSNITGTAVPTTYSWSGPSFTAATSNTSLSSVTTDMTGTYNFTVTATGSGCIATGSTNVTVNNLGVVAGNDAPACVGGTVDLTATPSGSEVPTNYNWSGPHSFVSTLQNPVISGATLLTAGTYTVTMSGTGTGCSTTATTTVTINTLSITAANDGPACVGGTINLTSSPSGTAVPTSYSWGGPLSFGAGTQNTNLTTSATTDMSGIYAVTVTATGSGCTAVGTTSVTVNSFGVAATNDGPACLNAVVILTSTPSGSAVPTSYSWSGPSSFSNTNQVTSIAPVAFSNAGVYTVTVTANGSACTATATTNVVIRSLSINAFNDGPTCAGLITNLTSVPGGTSVPTSYTWSGPLSFNATTQNTMLSPAAVPMTGTYTVVVTAVGTGCIATATTSVIVLPIPVSISGTPQMCVGSTSTLSDATAGGVWSSTNTGIATIGTAGAPTSPHLVSGLYMGTATISYTTSNGCAATVVVTVNPNPVITGMAPICLGSTLGLTDNIPGGTWSASNGHASVGTSTGVITGASIGTDVITYTLPTTCRTTAVATVNGAPNAIGGTPHVCQGQTTTLNEITGGGTWVSGNPSVATVGSSGSPVTVTGLLGGTTVVSYILPSGCYSSVVVTVNSLSAITGNAVVCQGSTLTLSDLALGGTWVSHTPAVATIGSVSGIVTGIAGGTSLISYTTFSGCQTTAVVTVSPATAILGTASVCEGGTTSLSDATAGGTWSSSSPANGSVAAGSGLVSGILAGTTTISYTITGSGCSATRVVTVNAAAGTITGTPTVCAGLMTNLTDGTPGGAWISGTPTKATVGTDGTVTGVAAGTSSITYKMTTGGCQATQVVTVNTTPATITGNAPVCQSATVTLHETTTGGAWSTLDISIAMVGSTGIVTGGSAGTATITYAMPTGCQNTTIVTVNPITPITGAAPVCVGATVSLTDATTGGNWSSSVPARGTVDASGNVTGIAAGPVNITYTIPATGCKAIAAETVNALPSAITGGSVVCSGGSTLALRDATTGGIWSSPAGSGGSATVDGSGNVTGTGAGTVTISYAVSGCSVSRTITVTATPAAITGNTPTCAGTALSLVETVGGGTWSSSNTAVATVGTDGTVTTVAGGTSTISYTTGAGCSASVVVTVNTILAITGLPSVCLASTTSLADVTPGGTWSSSAAGTASVGSTGIVTGNAIGTATISYTTASCTRTTTVTVNPVPTAIAGTLTTCASGTTSLSDDGSGVWSSTNTTVATIASTGVVSGVLAGTTTIKYTAGSGCFVSAVVTVNAGPSPIGGASSVCAGLTISLSDFLAGGTWSTTSSFASVDGSGNVLGISAGSAVITYTGPTGGCFVTRTIAVNALPAPVSGNPVVCIGRNTFLSDATGGGVSWTSSNTGVATISGSGAVTGVSSGNATMTYLVSSGCISTVIVTVNPQPSGISGNTPLCVGNSILLGDISGGGVWSSSNGTIATVGSDGTVTGASGGTAVISYVVNGGGCYATAIVTVTAVTPITGASIVCTGSSVTLNNTTAGGTWSSASGTVTVNASTGSVSGSSAGTAVITYTFAGGGCAATKTITVNTTPTAITGTGLLCIGTQLALSDAATGGSWTSSNTGVAGVSGSSGIVTGSAAGTATITYTLAGCQATTLLTVNTASPVTGFSSICAGGVANMHDGIGGGTWSSSNPAAGTISATGVVTGTGAGITTISYSLASGCVNTLVMTVNALPDAITGNGVICVGGILNLTDDITGGTWSSSNGVATVDGSGDVSAVAIGTATIAYTSATGCVTSVVVTVGATPAPITGTAVVCEGGVITLNDATLGGVWTSTLTNATVGSATGVVTGVAFGTTTISYTLAGCGSVSVDVTVNASPAAFTNNIPVCIGSSFTLGETTGGGTWSATGGNATVDGSGDVSGVTAGTATVSYTVASCSTTAVVTVAAMPAAITAPSFICLGSTTDLFDATAGGLWSTSDATVTLGTSTGVLTGVSIGTASITYTTATGCTATTIVSVNTATSPIFGALNLCISTSTLYTDATFGGAWSSSNTAVATVGTDGTVNGMAVGTATISYVTGGCISTQVIAVNPAPAGISGPSSVCPSSTITEVDATGGGVWSTTSSFISLDGSGDVSGLSSGVATITYTLGTGCFVTKVINISTAPSAVLGQLTVCVGATTFVSDATSGGVSWSSSNTTAATISNSGAVQGLSTGTSTITYTTTGGCFITAVVTVNAVPASISNNSAICQGTSIVLTDGSAGGSWTSSNSGIASVGTDGTLTGVSGGTAKITYTVNGAGCSTTAVATVNPLPNAGTLSGSGIVCVGATITYSDAAAGGTWSSTAIGTATVTASGAVTGIAPGTSAISYTVTNGCGTAAATAVVTVNPLPSAGTITGSVAVCAGSAGSLTDAVAGGTWSTSNSIASVDGSGNVTGVSGGTSIISYTVSSSCGSASATAIATINPISPITGTPSMCVGFTSTLTDATTGGTWSSSTTSVATVGSSTGVVSGVASGTSTVIYTSPSGCTRSVVITVTSSLPAITGTLGVCVGSTTALTDLTPGGTWTSSSPSLASVGGTTGIVTGSVAGTAHITYTVGGSCQSITTVTVNGAPSTPGGSATICLGSSITVSDLVSGGDWTSSGSVSSVATGTTLTTVTGNTLGTGTVTYTLAGSGCAKTKTITVNSLPTAILGNPVVCGIAAVTFLSDATAGTSWTISPVGTATVSGSGRVYGVSLGTATVTYTGTNTCIITTVVTVDGVPAVAAISGVNNVSHGSTVTLSDITPGGVWSSANSAIASVDGVGDVTGVAASGTTTISYTVTDALGCAGHATQSMTVHTPAPPSHVVGGTATLFTGTSVSIADEIAGGVWSSSNTGVATVDNAGSITGITPGAASITHISTTGWGETTTTVTPVIVSELPVDVRVVPNPNNGAFTVKGTLGTLQDEEVSLEVTDVLGQVIYTSKVMVHGGKINEKVSMNNTFANGMYMLTVHSGSENKVFHFVIEK